MHFSNDARSEKLAVLDEAGAYVRCWIFSLDTCAGLTSSALFDLAVAGPVHSARHYTAVKHHTEM